MNEEVPWKSHGIPMEAPWKSHRSVVEIPGKSSTRAQWNAMDVPFQLAKNTTEALRMEAFKTASKTLGSTTVEIPWNPIVYPMEVPRKLHGGRPTKTQWKPHM